jgi:hypothetical protein
MSEASTIKSNTVPDVVCPICFKPLTCPAIVNDNTDRYGRRLRTYFGWCFECGVGNNVIQFYRYGRWIIHKYKHAHEKGPGRYKFDDYWTQLNEMPEPPLLLTGPGGDYDSPIDRDLIADSLEMVQSTITKMGQLVDTLLEKIRQ